ncbi:MAG: DUF342 domain-containing protein [Lachnospiraceae bacterium]
MALVTNPCIPEISLSSDMMSAKLKLHLDDNGQQLSVDDLVEILGSRNVKTGIDRDALTRMIEHNIYEIFVEVAKGKAPVKGKDGYFIFHVSQPEEQKGPKILEDGSVEYVHTTEYTIVEEGDLLAEYVHATGGEYGYTIDNAMRTPMRGKELPCIKGKGFRIEDDKYYSVAHGRIDFTETSIHITNLLEVSGDVDISYGHIQFDGDVYIRGDVKSGMMVRASGNIDIKGHVGNCYIEAGKNLTLNNGMQGKFSGKLKAGGDITCKFFENSQAEAGGNITLKNSMNSKISAEGKVLVEGKEAVVLGGSVHAIQGMEITEAGNENEISTTLVAGVLQETMARDVELTHLIEKVEGEVDLLDRSAHILDRMAKTKATQENSARRMKIIQAKVIKSTELKKYKDEKMRSEALIASGKDACIVVNNTIHPGCRVNIAGSGVDVNRPMKHVKFVLRDGNVEANLLF